jgi:HEAT repeat protein
VHNGVVIHEMEEVTGPTRAAAFRDEKPEGPLMFQGDHGPVAYRNIWVRRMGPGEERDTWDRKIHDRTIPEWLADLDHGLSIVSRQAAATLAQAGPDALCLLSGALRHEDLGVRFEVARGMAGSDERKSLFLDDLAAALKDEALPARSAAAYALRGTKHEKAAIGVLIEALDEEHRNFSPVAAGYLGEFGPAAKEAIPALEKMAESRHAGPRASAVRALQQIRE